MSITRYRGAAKGRNRAVAYQDLVFTVATAPDKGQDMAGQTRQCLAELDRNLADAGSHKTRILSATVYVADIGQKEAMDAVWREWLGPDPDHWPQRACVEAGLSEGTLVEIVLAAARSG